MAIRDHRHDEVQVRLARENDRGTCLAIRRRVFIDEQGVPESAELDGLDREAVSWIARLGDQPIGTARARILAGSAKAERVAVLPEYRRRGVGEALMLALERWAFEEGLGRVALNAQEAAVPFYKRLGYAIRGEPFEEAGIPHRAMAKPTGADPPRSASRLE